jgi:hypothetical protein
MTPPHLWRLERFLDAYDIWASEQNATPELPRTFGGALFQEPFTATDGTWWSARTGFLNRRTRSDATASPHSGCRCSGYLRHVTALSLAAAGRAVDRAADGQGRRGSEERSRRTGKRMARTAGARPTRQIRSRSFIETLPTLGHPFGTPVGAINQGRARLWGGTVQRVQQGAPRDGCAEEWWLRVPASSWSPPSVGLR